jgi:hypothetical protein
MGGKPNYQLKTKTKEKNIFRRENSTNHREAKTSETSEMDLKVHTWKRTDKNGSPLTTHHLLPSSETSEIVHF